MFRTFAQFLFKLLFPKGQGGMKETFGNSGGEGGLFPFTKMEIPERWGVLAGIPSVVGVWIFSGTTHCIFWLHHVSKLLILGPSPIIQTPFATLLSVPSGSES